MSYKFADSFLAIEKLVHLFGFIIRTYTCFALSGKLCFQIYSCIKRFLNSVGFVFIPFYHPMTSQVEVVMTSYFPPGAYVCWVSSNWVSILCITVEYDVHGKTVGLCYVGTT